MAFGLIQEQSQKLVMTMQMKQAIEVLQCSSMELHEYIAEQIADNPFAEMIPVSTEQAVHFGTTGKGVWQRGGANRTQSGLPLEQTVRSELSLVERLEQQLGLQPFPGDVLNAARYVIGCLNESGYLTESVETVSEILDAPPSVVIQAVEAVQTLEPPGIGARNLQECLLLQLGVVTEPLQAVVKTLIEHHLEDIASGRIPAIAKKLKLPVETIQLGIDALRKLNPRPGLSYASERPDYLIPDVVVERVGKEYVVVPNQHSEPRVQLSRVNRNVLNGGSGEEAREFAQKKLNSAQWLVKCLEQRRFTLHRVAQAMVEFQQEFLINGRAHMRPLTLKQVADHLGLHESTVSRATRGKYMQTPRGVYDMRFFFSSELQSEDGVTSAEAAKDQIQRLVNAEDPLCPMSDEVITKQLIDAGIHISRRTVAKYREEMGIATSVRRRRFA